MVNRVAFATHQSLPVYPQQRTSGRMPDFVGMGQFRKWAALRHRLKLCLAPRSGRLSWWTMQPRLGVDQLLEPQMQEILAQRLKKTRSQTPMVSIIVALFLPIRTEASCSR
jgi:hypothetical protein